MMAGNCDDDERRARELVRHLWPDGDRPVSDHDIDLARKLRDVVMVAVDSIADVLAAGAREAWAEAAALAESECDGPLGDSDDDAVCRETGSQVPKSLWCSPCRVALAIRKRAKREDGEGA